jgi:hypothetical protein
MAKADAREKTAGERETALKLREAKFETKRDHYRAIAEGHWPELKGAD